MSGREEVSETDIYDRQGRRKYLTAAERRRFRRCAERLPPRQREFCLMLYYTGARISEVLGVTVGRIDVGDGVVVLRSLKKRKEGVFRAVPLPRNFLKDLLKTTGSAASTDRLWPFVRKTGYRIVKNVMREAGIVGIHAVPKGLRHGFGIACVQNDIPLPTITKWMGHSSIKTTAIYLNAVGKEERQFAKRIW